MCKTLVHSCVLLYGLGSIPESLTGFTKQSEPSANRDHNSLHRPSVQHEKKPILYIVSSTVLTTKKLTSN